MNAKSTEYFVLVVNNLLSYMAYLIILNFYHAAF